MNNYLTNMAARSMTPAPALQPRLRSRFEPVSRVGSLAAELPISNEPMINEIVAERQAEPAPVSPRWSDIHRSNAVRLSTEREPAPLTVPELTVTGAANVITPTTFSIPPAPPATPAPVTASTSLPATSATSHDQQPVELDERVPESAAQRRAETGATVSPPAQVGTSPPSERIQTVVNERIVIKELERQRESERQVLPKLLAEAESSQRATELGYTSSVAPPQIMPRFDQRSEASANPDQPPPAPTIRVTIGRIEVRAMPANTSAAPKPRPAQPTLSLDDYLRRRGNTSGGR